MTARLIAGLVVGLLGLASAPAARAQDALPANLVSAPAGIDTAGRDQIKTYVGKYAPDLSSKEIPVFQRARTAILEPLAQNNVSVSFRSAYTDELLPVIQPLIAEPASAAAGPQRDLVAVNALRIAGELATAKATALLEAGVKSKTTSVRYAAIAGIGRTFDAMARTAPAIDAGSARALINKLGPMLRAETDSFAFDALVRALMSAAAVDRQDWGSLREDAIAQLAAAISDRFQKLANKPADDQMMQALIRAVSAGRDAMANLGGKPLGPAAAKAVAEMGSDAVAYIHRLVQAKAFPAIVAGDPPHVEEQKTAMRKLPADLVSVSFAAITLANDSLLGQPLPKTSLPQLLQSAQNQDDARFLESARDLIGANGAMSKPPFAFAKDRFLR